MVFRNTTILTVDESWNQNSTIWKVLTAIFLAACTNASLTSRHLIIIHGSLFCTSAVVCLFALSWLACLKLRRQLLYRLASYPVIRSLLMSVFEVFQFHFLSYDDSKYTLCVIITYLDQVAALIKLCFGGWVTFHLFYFVLFYKNLTKLGALVRHNISAAPYCDFGYSFSDRVVWAKWTVVLDTKQEAWL